MSRLKGSPTSYFSRLVSTACSLTFLFILNAVLLVTLSILQFIGAMGDITWWSDAYAIASNILISCFVSFIFYFLLVHVPESRRSEMLKKNALSVYRSVKKDILFNVLSASIKGGRKDIELTYELIDKLMKPENFRHKFEDGREADEGFYAFENQMSHETYEFVEITHQLGILSRHLNFLMHNFPFKDGELFQYITRLENLLLRIQASGAGYDESKPLCRFVFQIYAGWDWVSGYIGYDRIEKALKEL